MGDVGCSRYELNAGGGGGWGGAVCWSWSWSPSRPGLSCPAAWGDPGGEPQRGPRVRGYVWLSSGRAGEGAFHTFCSEKHVSREGTLRGGPDGVRDEVPAGPCTCMSMGRSGNGKCAHATGFPASSPGPGPRGDSAPAVPGAHRPGRGWALAAEGPRRKTRPHGALRPTDGAAAVNALLENAGTQR